MLKAVLSTVLFLVVYLGAIVIYITHVYVALEQRVQRGLGQRMGVKITSPVRVRGTGWTIAGKHTARQSFLVFIAQTFFVVISIIVPMMLLLALLIALLAVINGGM